MSDFVAMPQRPQDIDEGQSSAPRPPIEALADMVVHRVFGIGLVLQSAAGLAEDPVAERISRAVDELDAIIRDVRAAAIREADQSWAVPGSVAAPGSAAADREGRRGGRRSRP